MHGKATPQSASLTAPLLGEPFCTPLLFSALFCSLLPHGLSLELAQIQILAAGVFAFGGALGDQDFDGLDHDDEVF